MENFSATSPLKIDNRPLWLIALDRTRRYQILALLAAAFIAVLQFPPPDGLSIHGYRALALFLLTVSLWVSGLLPIGVTALLSMALLPLLGVMPQKQVFSLFGNEALFFILGAFILAAAMTGTGLTARIARAVLVRYGRSPQRLALSVFLLSALLSFCMSEHAVAAMLFPVVSEIVASLELEPGRNYPKLLYMSIAWGCIIGGIATFLGGARAPLAVGLLKEGTGLGFSFLEWSAAACMIVLPLLAVGFRLLLRFFPTDIDDVSTGIRFLTRKRLEMGKLTPQEGITALIVTLTIAGWVIFGRDAGLATVAIIATAALFAFRVVSWEKVEGFVNWGILLMYGGSIALASALEKSGAAIWLVERGLKAFSPTPFMVIAVISLISIILTECISHAAVVAILMPIGLGLSKSIGIDPKVMTLAIALPAGLAYSLPMGTPALAIVYGSGFLKSRDIIGSGMIIMAISWLLFMASAMFVWPLIGLKI